MRIVFMGTPDFAAAILEYLGTQHEVVAVYTRPDAVRGRGKALVPSPVKAMAAQMELPVYTPKTLRDSEAIEQLKAFEADAFCVAAYGMLLPPEVLAIPKYGCFNAHASLLPRWRGAAPVERSILEGDFETGVCIMKMEEGLDTGDWCVSRAVEIGDRTATDLLSDLSLIAAQAMLTALAQVETGLIRWNKQDETKVTYARKIEKAELNISPDDSAEVALRKIRCCSEAHPSKCVIGGRTLTVLSAKAADVENDVEKGQVKLVAKRLLIGFGDGVIDVCEVKPDGKSAMEGKAFAAGLQGVKQGNVTWEGIDA